MALKNVHYFRSDSDWERFSTDPTRDELALKTEATSMTTLDVAGDRRMEAVKQAEFLVKHPTESYGYSAHEMKIHKTDDIQVPIRMYRPERAGEKTLPLLFVTHGGGWVQGNPTTEEIWLLSPILKNIDIVIVSVDYRLVPECHYPCQVNECWGALQWVMNHSVELSFDSSQVFLAGSSSGGCLAAVLSQKARDAGTSIAGVILNVPVTCHPKFFPRERFEYTSYDQCDCTLLTATEMRLIWELYTPSSSLGKEPTASPLLGNLVGLPRHLIFVAGQDPLRDEGIAYAEALEKAAVSVKKWVYQGVPHNFATFWELQKTKRFHSDLEDGFQALLTGNSWDGSIVGAS